ncbi:ABC transporter ATP-binding protein [Lyngbya confervoides]|uniref:Energy-coupling factor transporter ATPase n=1 Tax=Lyngbya confervoides BDU141951 TaxID=1574623 RepID=A0ABD4T0A1_9CYAN|nr:energy-coupling factor transporter ATPase [Lyngbya confervoides]MCM1981866.1 energy-coupling factor transporter ATPase [Lyngbya confervoides BDU141951]
MDSLATFHKVSYLYPGTQRLALRDISLTLESGEFFGLIGPTGAGKTTLCLALNGIVPQFFGGRFFGYVTVAGLDTLTHPVSTLAQRVGAVFEDPATQLTATSVENEIAFALENLKVPPAEIRARIPQVLAAVRLEGTEQKHPQDLSGGQQQRLAIAAALALRPRLLILDEPTSQLDPVGTQEVFATVKALNQDLGMTIVMVSHAAEEMAQYCDRIALLSGGELVATGTPAQIYSQPELLWQHDLRAPQVAQVFEQLNAKGLAVHPIPVTLDAGKQAMTPLIQQATPAEFPLPGLPHAPGALPLLSVQGLSHTYADGTQALRDLSLDIHAGEYVLVVGQNGAGKSTLVKHFLNLLQPTQGTVWIEGRKSTDYTVSELARRIGYVAQNPDNQIFNTTVEREVTFALKNLGYGDTEIQEKAGAALEAMDLMDLRQAHPLSLPKGDRARIVIAAILAMNPEVIILDEPTVGQDYRGSREILEVSQRLHRMGKTLMVITHHLHLMPGYAERAIVMGKGTLLLDAPLRSAYHQTDQLAATYLTPPQTVLLAQHLSKIVGHNYPLLTPGELADCLTKMAMTQDIV